MVLRTPDDRDAEPAGILPGADDRESELAPAPALVAEEPRGADEVGEEPSRVPAPANALECVLTGVVRVDGQLEGLPGARVLLYVGDRSGPELLTDRAGRYRQAWPGPVDLTRIKVLPGTRTASLDLIERRTLVPGVHERNLWLPPTVSLAGRVVDAEGRGLAAAEVVAWLSTSFDPRRTPDRRTSVAADGSFVLEHVGGRFHAIARAPKLRTVWGLTGTLEPGPGWQGAQIVMEPACAVAGVVVDELGQPIRGATVWTRAGPNHTSPKPTTIPGTRWFDATDGRAVTDDQGEFVIESVGCEAAEFHVSHEDYPFRAAILAPGQHNRIASSPSGSATGTVSGPDGQPIAGAKVEITSPNGRRRAAQTDAAGRFTLRGLGASDRGTLLVRAAGCALFALQPVVFDEVRPARVDVQLVPESSLAGRVVDEQGQAAPGTLLRIEGPRLLDFGFTVEEPTTLEWAFKAQKTRAGPDGSFRFDALNAGAYVVHATPVSSQTEQQVGSFSAGEQEIVLTVRDPLAGRVVYSGRVVDGITRAPLREFRVEAYHWTEDRPELAASARVASEEAGYVLPGLAVRACQLRFAAGGYHQIELRHEPAGPGPVTIDAELLPYRRLELEFVDAHGARVLRSGRLRVSLSADAGALEDAGSWNLGLHTADEAGRCRIERLPPRALLLEAQVQGYRGASVRVDLTQAQQAPLGLVLLEP